MEEDTAVEVHRLAGRCCCSLDAVVAGRPGWMLAVGSCAVDLGVLGVHLEPGAGSVLDSVVPEAGSVRVELAVRGYVGPRLQPQQRFSSAARLVCY